MYKWKVTAPNGAYFKGEARDFPSAQIAANKAYLFTDGQGEIEVGPGKRWVRKSKETDWVREEFIR